MKKLFLILIIFMVSLSMSAHNGDSSVKSKVIKTDKGFEVIKFYENGNVQENEFFDLCKNKTGCWKRFSESGIVIAEANFKNDKKNGEWKIYNDKGQMIFYIKYKNGKKEVLSTWNEQQGLVVR